jgi:hypothetical protein
MFLKGDIVTTLIAATLLAVMGYIPVGMFLGMFARLAVIYREEKLPDELSPGYGRLSRYPMPWWLLAAAVGLASVFTTGFSFGHVESTTRHWLLYLGTISIIWSLFLGLAFWAQIRDAEHQVNMYVLGILYRLHRGLLVFFTMGCIVLTALVTWAFGQYHHQTLSGSQYVQPTVTSSSWMTSPRTYAVLLLAVLTGCHVWWLVVHIRNRPQLPQWSPRSFHQAGPVLQAEQPAHDIL